LTAASANEFAEVILGGSIVIPAAFAFFGAEVTAKASGSIFDLGFITMPLLLQKVYLGQVFGFFWFALLFIAGITSSISLAQPAVAFLEDEFNLSKKEAVLVFGLVTYLLCHLAIFGLGSGVVDELDFWGGTLCLVLFGTIETILFGWVYGMDKAWTELHVGSDITIPRFYRFIIKYVTPVFLLLILVFYFIQGGVPLLTLQGVQSGNVTAILFTRLILVFLFVLVALLVWIAWKRRAAGNAPAAQVPPAEGSP